MPAAGMCARAPHPSTCDCCLSPASSFAMAASMVDLAAYGWRSCCRTCSSSAMACVAGAKHVRAHAHAGTCECRTSQCAGPLGTPRCCTGAAAACLHAAAPHSTRTRPHAPGPELLLPGRCPLTLPALRSACRAAALAAAPFSYNEKCIPHVEGQNKAAGPCCTGPPVAVQRWQWCVQAGRRGAAHGVSASGGWQFARAANERTPMRAACPAAPRPGGSSSSITSSNRA